VSTTNDFQGNLGYAIKQLQHLLRAAIEQRLRASAVGLTFPHALTLYLLAQRPGLSGAQLARDAFVSAQTMNQILTRLEADGLIERAPDPQHGRILKARVTARGMAEFQRGCVIADDLIEAAQQGLSSDERALLLTLLARVQANLLALEP
jgi:DNA-binding MarR family transcriptional regulator